MPESLVIIRRVPEGYQVDVQPPLPDGLDRARTFQEKCGAWNYAQGIWSDYRLGLRDETVNNVKFKKRPRGPYQKCSFF